MILWILLGSLLAFAVVRLLWEFIHDDAQYLGDDWTSVNPRHKGE